MGETTTRRQQLLNRWEALKTERSSWLSHWQDLSNYVLPRKSRFLLTDRNRGTKKNDKIVNSIPTFANRTLAAGIMTGLSSPARDWFSLTTADPALAEVGEVRSYLNTVEERIRWALARSNLYNQLSLVYSNLPTFGVSVLYIEEDPKTLFRGYVFPVGSYCLANSDRLEIDTCFRELSMTVAQLVRHFTPEKCSERVRNLYTEKKLDVWIDVLHAIQPNTDYVEGKLGRAGKKFCSDWLELAGDMRAPMLLEAGFEIFPGCAPRWEVTGEDVYGSSPGMEVLGDAKALQLLELRKAQLVDKIVTPPMRGPTSLQFQRTSLLPGDVTYVDALGENATFAPAMVVPPQALPAVNESIRDHEERIKTGYYVDLFLALLQETKTMTAREVAERHDEKLLQLGPVLDRLMIELLTPMIDRVFAILQKNGELPPPPQVLQGLDIRVEYTSSLAQAQKLLATTGIERLAGFVGQMAAAQQSMQVFDKLNSDEVVDEYAAALGVKPDLVRSDEEVDTIRAERAKAQQAAQAQAQAAATADTAKTLASTPLENDSALTRMLGNLGAPTGAGGAN